MCIYIIELLCVVSKSTSLSSYLEEVCFLLSPLIISVVPVSLVDIMILKILAIIIHK